ncbi:MAG: restriction endonuclease subunit R, partial [Gallionella sp.]
MKLHFESNLDYQLAAIEAVCDLFRGQEICRSEFTVTMHSPATPVGDDLFPGTMPQQMSLGVTESDLGIGNKLTLLDDEIAENLHAIQLRGGLPPSGTLASGDFTVEMETGTGKTYVY